MPIRQPIVSVLGHVDHGKTSLLDRIRTSSVAAKEAGGITQHIGATEVPLSTIKEICASLLREQQIKIPGLLFIDTPGHEAFTTLRRRGGSIADLAVLVVDVTEGFQPQTIESLTFLREFRVPFIVAANKIDKVRGWVRHAGTFADSYKKQNKETRELLDNKIYELMGQLSEHGFVADRYDRISDFRSTVIIVPVCAANGEGVPELMAMLIGLAQQFLTQKLEIKGDIGAGSVLEIKEVKGLGTTIDVILYDGVARKGDFLVIGGETPIVTTVKGIFKPRPLAEMRVERQFAPVDEIIAAAGSKMVAPNLEGVIPGSPIRVVPHKSDVDAAVRELKREVETVTFESSNDGVLVKADTLGALEAMIKIITSKGIAIRKARIGPVSRTDVMEQRGVAEPYNVVIFAFNVPVAPEAEALRESVHIFAGNVIYRLIEDYVAWTHTRKEELKLARLEGVVRPGKIRLLPGMVFHAAKPAIVGVEVLGGLIKPGYSLVKEGRIVGRLLQVQHEGANVQEAKTGDRVAVSIEGATVGRGLEERDVLYTLQSKENVKKLEELKDLLTRDEIDVLEEIKGLMGG
ncbi:MAG: translation initiation factor IF-2 [Candidatus Aenigmatarchaeota archaeon]|nr:MAG: translation initiation factor IF-2 [Candidatus Aenigmarchaeota archaeon]